MPNNICYTYELLVIWLKPILILLLILSYIGGVGAVISYGVQTQSIPYKYIFIILLITVINLASARYLYREASHNQIEWGLFGAFGNINAILVFWFCRAIQKG